MKAKAVLLSVNFKTEEVHATFIEKDKDNPDPVHSCRELQAGIEDDWPDAKFAVLADEEAVKIMVHNRKVALGLEKRT